MCWTAKFTTLLHLDTVNYKIHHVWYWKCIKIVSVPWGTWAGHMFPQLTAFCIDFTVHNVLSPMRCIKHSTWFNIGAVVRDSVPPFFFFFSYTHDHDRLQVPRHCRWPYGSWWIHPWPPDSSSYSQPCQVQQGQQDSIKETWGHRCFEDLLLICFPSSNMLILTVL